MQISFKTINNYFDRNMNIGHNWEPSRKKTDCNLKIYNLVFKNLKLQCYARLQNLFFMILVIQALKRLNFYNLKE